MNAQSGARRPAVNPADHLLTNAAVSQAARIDPAPAANLDTHEPADDRRVNPLWMITVVLGGFFALMLLLLTFS